MPKLKHAFDSIASKTQASLHAPLQESEVMNLQTRLNQVAMHLIEAKLCSTRTWKRKMADAAGCSYQNIRQAAIGDQVTMDEVYLRRIAGWAGVSERFMVLGVGPMLPREPSSSTMQNEALPTLGESAHLVAEASKLYLQGPLRIESPQVTKQRRAPLIEWARLGDELPVDNIDVDAQVHLPVSEGVSRFAKWATSPNSYPRFGIRSGYRLLFDRITKSECIDGDIYLFETVSGSLFLGEYRRLTAGHFEAVPDAGPPMDSQRHGIKLVAELIGIYKK